MHAWARCLRWPVRTYRHLSKTCVSDELKAAQALRLWLITFLITLVIEAPVYWLSGIDLENKWFHLPHMLFVFLASISAAWAIHAGLRAHGIASRWGETLLGYSAVVGVFTPLLALITYPNSIPIYAKLRVMKQQHMAIGDAIRFFFATPASTEHSQALVCIRCILVIAASIIPIVLTVALVRELATRYDADRTSMFRAFAFGLSVLGTMALAPWTLALWFTLYVFAR